MNTLGIKTQGTVNIQIEHDEQLTEYNVLTYAHERINLKYNSEVDIKDIRTGLVLPTTAYNITTGNELASLDYFIQSIPQGGILRCINYEPVKEQVDDIALYLMSYFDTLNDKTYGSASNGTTLITVMYPDGIVQNFNIFNYVDNYVDDSGLTNKSKVAFIHFPLTSIPICRALPLTQGYKVKLQHGEWYNISNPEERQEFSHDVHVELTLNKI